MQQDTHKKHIYLQGGSVIDLNWLKTFLVSYLPIHYFFNFMILSLKYSHKYDGMLATGKPKSSIIRNKFQSTLSIRN